MDNRGVNKTGVEIKGLIERVYSIHNFNYKCYYEVGELKCLKIALINGFCIGAGNAFLWGSDYQIVNDNSYFQIPETGLGIYPDAMATYYMPRIKTGYSMGLYIGLMGHSLKGKEILKNGLASHYVNCDIKEIEREIKE